MNYDDLAAAARELGYREKLKLAQLLLQLAVKEEEEQNPDHRTPGGPGLGQTDAVVQYVLPRLLKLRPVKKDGVLKSISAMYQFQGGISEADRERIFAALVKQGHIRVDANKVSYP